MTSQAKVDANRRNSKKSTGPRTAEGKKRASRNALKHGLTAKQVVLPGENPLAFEEKLNHCLDYYDVDDPIQADLLERVVASKWKLDRCTRVETERLSEKVRHAEHDYDLEKFSEAEEIGRRLIYDPLNRCQNAATYDPVVRARIEKRSDDNPAILARQLQTTAQGVDWLIDRWVELGEMLHQHGYWHYPEKFRAIWLLGKRPEDFLEDKLLQRIYLAANVAHPDTDDTDPDAFDLLDECIQAKLGIEGKPMYFVQVNEIRRFRPGDKQTAQAILWDIFTSEITRLRELKVNHLDPIDDADRAGAQTRAMFDGSHEAVLLRRYETACEREFHRAIADFSKLRKDAAHAEPVPDPETKPEPQPGPETEALAQPEPTQAAEVSEAETVSDKPFVSEAAAPAHDGRNEASSDRHSEPERAEGAEESSPGCRALTAAVAD